jgi:hypothetical protein
MPVKKAVGEAADVHVVPSDVSKLPEVPGATNPTAKCRYQAMTLLAVSVAAPVPQRRQAAQTQELKMSCG